MNSFAEKDQVVLMVTKLKMSQQCTLVASRPAESWAVLGSTLPGSDLSSLFSTGKTASGVLCLVVDFTVQYRYGHTEPSTAKSHKDE